MIICRRRGGSLGPLTPVQQDKIWLNITAVAGEAGFFPIHGFADHWFAFPQEVISIRSSAPGDLGDYVQFSRLVRRLAAHCSYAKERQFYQMKSATESSPDDKAWWPSEIEGDLKVLKWWATFAMYHSPAPEVIIDPKQGLARHWMAKATLPSQPVKDYLLSFDGVEFEPFEVGRRTKFPTEKFIVMPKNDLLSSRQLGNVFSFEFIPGAPIGLEWWHHQMTKLIQGKKWVDLVGSIGWTEEGLQATASFDGQVGLGFTVKDLSADAH